MYFYSIDLPDGKDKIDLFCHGLLAPVANPNEILKAKNACQVYLSSDHTVDVQTHYLFFFCNFGSDFRLSIFPGENNLAFSDNSTWNIISSKYKDVIGSISEELREKVPGCEILINVSFGDCCLAIPTSVGEDKQFELHNWLKERTRANSSNDLRKTFSPRLYEVQAEISKRFNNQHVYKYLPYYREGEELVRNLLNANVDTEDRLWECTLQALLLLRKFLDEINLFVFYDNGELRDRDFEEESESKFIFEKIESSFEIFLKQANTSSFFSDQVWSYLFLTKALLAALAGRTVREATSMLGSSAYYIHNDFYGFVPIIPTGSITLRSFFWDHVMPVYTFGFLTLPHSITFRLWEQLPGYVHEFFHYVTTPNRKKRNALVLDCVFLSCIQPLISALYKNQSSGGQLLETFVEAFRQQYHQNILTPNIIFTEFEADKMEENMYEDSMFFFRKNREPIKCFDFGALYDSFLSCVASEDIPILLEKRQVCLEKWEKDSMGHLFTYSITLREIRSDMAMCILLDIGLEEYIEIMLTQPFWGTFDETKSGDSMIFRLGFIARYLFLKEASLQGTSFSDVNEFNKEWECTTFSLLEDIRQKQITSNERIENVKKYIEQYICAMIQQEQNRHIEVGHSIFEQKLYSPMQISVSKEGIAMEWERQFEKDRENTIFRILRNHYQKYRKYIKSNAYEDAVMMNYQARLILRDVFSFFPDVDK